MKRLDDGVLTNDCSNQCKSVRSDRRTQTGADVDVGDTLCKQKVVSSSPLVTPTRMLCAVTHLDRRVSE